MIFGSLTTPETYEFLCSNRAWRQAFDWLKEHAATAAPGLHHLEGENLFVNVHGYATLPRDACAFESHRRYYDLQYCIQGGEKIDWEESGLLSPREAYDPVKDVIFYQPAEVQTTLQMLPGRFSIFGPSDAHRPKVSDGAHPEVAKLVIKIARELLHP